MKSLVTGLLIISMVGCARGASTETIAEVRDKVVELHITLKPEVVKALNRHKRRIEQFASKAVCSGAFVTRNGYILTAKHCTEGADEITVITSDGQEYLATVMGASKTQDLAVIRIDRTETPSFRLADNVTQGEKIYTYGSPLGISGTMTTGVVARLNGDVTYIDCGVLPGNSGGPVFNEDGEMVGVATAGFIVLLGTTHLNIMQSLDSLRYFAFELAGQR